MKQEVLKVITSNFGLKYQEVKKDNYIFIEVNSEDLIDILLLLKDDLGFTHLSSIVCTDWIKENNFALTYNLFSYKGKMLLSVKTCIMRTNARHPSIKDIFTAAWFFERDIHEMFGIEFEGGDNTKFILDEWEGPPPMLKDFKTKDYVNDNFSWRAYFPQWAKDLGIKKEDLEGEDLELI